MLMISYRNRNSRQIVNATLKINAGGTPALPDFYFDKIIITGSIFAILAYRRSFLFSG